MINQSMLSPKHIAKINQRDSRLRQRDFLFFIYIVDDIRVWYIRIYIAYVHSLYIYTYIYINRYIFFYNI